MFFGGKKNGGGAEPVKQDGLEYLLNSLFDNKLGSLERRASSITMSIDHIGIQFHNECTAFEVLDAGPYTEDLYTFDVNFIKRQKTLYARELRGIVEGLDLETEAPNIYSRYSIIYSNLDGLRNAILKTNARFKNVMYSYGRHLGDLKRTFSSMERSVDLLKNELDKRKGELSEYNEVMEGISMLKSINEELGTLNGDMEALKGNIRDAEEKVAKGSGSGIHERLSTKEAELSKISDEESNLSNRIKEVVLPLEKASKKFDHMASGKKRLHIFIAEPLASIRNDADYRELRELLLELNAALDSGVIDIKNVSEAKDAVLSILGSDINSMINTLRSLRDGRESLEKEVKVLKRLVEEMEVGRSSMVKSLREVGAIERNVKEIEKSRESAKNRVEKLFIEYYKKKIIISL